MKKDNLGKICILKALHYMERTAHGSTPTIEDYLPFVIVGVSNGGYIINRVENTYGGVGVGGSFIVKTKDIIIKD